MAQRKQRRTSWSRRALFYIFFPLVVWGIAFLVWFYWYDLRRVGKQDYTDRPKAAGDSDSEPKERPAKIRPQEKIQEEDRKKLEDIIKRRG
jgi:hypothetical protein